MVKTMKPVKKTLSVDELVLDGGTQSRAEVSEYTVERYVEVLEEVHEAGLNKWPFPPVVVYHDGSQYLVASGFHRTLAAQRFGRASIPCEIFQGTAWDALLHGMGANRRHGLPPSREDNKHSVELLLDSSKRLSQKEISEIVGVATRTVRRIVAERKPQPASGAPGSPSRGGDPFDVEPFEDEGNGEDSGTDSGTDAKTNRPPGSKETSEGSSETDPPARDEFKIQKSKTRKTAEALVRAFDDLNRLRKSEMHEPTISTCQTLIKMANNWK